ITPHSTNTSPAMQTYDYNYNPYSSFAELIETKPDGKKVTHWFIGLSCYYYSYNPGVGAIYHSIDMGSSWNLMSPSNWSSYSYDGSCQLSLKTVDHTWTDSNGSSWNGKLLVYANNRYTEYSESLYYSYRMYRPSVYRYDGNGTDSLWTPLLTDLPGYGTGFQYAYYWSYGYGSKTFIEEFNGKLYIVAYQFVGMDPSNTYYSLFKVSVFRYDGDQFAQTPPSSSSSWTRTWQSPSAYQRYYYYGPPTAYAFKKHIYAGTNYLFLSTSSTSNIWDYPLYQYQYGGALYRTINGTSFDSYIIPSYSYNPPGAPLCFESFKGYLYAGFGCYDSYGQYHLYRVSNVSGNLSSLAWENCGPVSDSGRTLINAAMALAKTKTKDPGGSIVDNKLYVGGYCGQYEYAPQFRYINSLFSTEGLNAGGTTTVPLKFKLEEDEWLNKYQWMYCTYDIFSSSMGLVVSTYTYYWNAPYYYRYFHIFNAPPSLEIDHEPKPVINERGTYTQFTIWMTPIGGFGPGDIRIELELPLNVFVPRKDADGNVIPENLPFLSMSWPMNGNPLTLTPIIKSTLSAPLGIFDAKLIVTDLTLGITVEYLFKIQIIPPKPGFTSLVMPSYAQVFRGDCQRFTVDITTRNDFDRNVIINIVWITAPPSDDVTINWERSPLIYDYISDTSVEVRTRRNMGTRYFFTACTTDNTTLGTYKFRVTFMSGSIYKYVDVTFVVLRPPATFSITPVPATAKVVPGGSAYYRVKIESKNGYVGFIALSLQNLPQPTDITTFKAESPPSGYPDNYVELTLSQPFTYAILEIKTYATYRDTGGNLIQGTPSGLHYIKVVGEGQGFDPDGNPVTPTAFGIAGLHIFQQIEDMKTPSFTFWGMILILIGIFGSITILLKKREKTIELK
ncbi:MAG TPA: hypothetical protein PLD35_04745, partial [Caldisericia bacterium]|nr:hypothetical protein [Caldisericia bacterium]